MVNVSLQFLNLISPSKVKHMLQNSELPSGKSSINHILSHSYAQITNNDALKTALNPYNVPVQQMQSKAVDVANYNRAQFLSRRSFEFDENMVVYIKEYRPYNCNMQVYDSIVNNNYEVHKFSEKSVFHQAELKKYDNNLFSEVKSDLVINIDEAMELIRPFY